MAKIDRVLKKVFGFTSFRPQQRELCEALASGRDVLAVMPTGGGKSLCFQLPAVMMKGTTIVVTPLISLMQDQVRSATENGIVAEFVNSMVPTKAKARIYRDLQAGRVKLLYIAPELLITEKFQTFLDTIKIAAFIIDEAHCIRDGAEFRPSYWKMAPLVQERRRPIAAFTATATIESQEDIRARMGLKTPFVVRSSFDRENLYYEVRSKDVDLISQIEGIIEENPGPGIVYRTTRDDVESTARKLRIQGYEARPYHAGLPKSTRNDNQIRFLNGDVEVMVATIAFGMGIDKPDIRWIVHADIPKNMEGYYQETGRAGRDGQPSRCYFLYSIADIPKTRSFIDKIKDRGHRERSYGEFLVMVRYGQRRKCRRHLILKYFNEEYPDYCGNCDICIKRRR